MLDQETYFQPLCRSPEVKGAKTFCYQTICHVFCAIFIFKVVKSKLLIVYIEFILLLGAVHILRQPPEGGEGVSQMLTIADEGGRGGKPNADDC